MKHDDKIIMKNYITEDEPFGPIDASEIENPRAFEILFEHHNKIYKALHQRPSIVVGRKGSGKTSYLNSVYFDNGFDYVSKLEAADAFTNVINSVSDVSHGVVFAENVAKLWENVLYIGLFGYIRWKLPKSSKSRNFINDYLAKIGIRDGDTLDDVLWKITDIISTKRAEKPHGILAELLQQLDSVTFQKTKTLLLEELNDENNKAIILLDSLDDFQLHVDSVGRAIQGLLKFVGDSNKPSCPVDIRLCVPGELYHRFLSVSSNPNKDFRRKLVLHWVASELIMVASHRLNIFFHIHRDKEILRLTGVDDKRVSRRFLRQIFPDKFSCTLGVEEDPIAYILRHTQLLPRHLLIILNSIYSKNRKNASDNYEMKFTEESIITGIAAVEETLVKEIFVAFKTTYPHAEGVCEQCIPELHHKFSIGDLERVFRTHGKKAMESDDLIEFKRMLVEIGAVGRVLDDTGRYIKAEFEYTAAHKLVTSTDDLLCLHPLFTVVFSAKIRERKPVYPYGSLEEDKDYRRYD